MKTSVTRRLAVQVTAGILFCGAVLSQPVAAQGSHSQPAALTGLMAQHVTLSVENLDRETEWYVNVLGFKATPRVDTNPAFLVQHVYIPGYRIDLIQFKGSTRPASVDPIYLRQGWIHVAFSVPNLSVALKQLQALHTDVTVGTKDAEGLPTRLVLHDPEGNEFELFNR